MGVCDHLAALCHTKDGFCSVPMVTDFAALYAQEEVPRDLDSTIKKLQGGEGMIFYCPFAEILGMVRDGLYTALCHWVYHTNRRCLKDDLESSHQVLAHTPESL